MSYNFLIMCEPSNGKHLSDRYKYDFEQKLIDASVALDDTPIEEDIDLEYMDETPGELYAHLLNTGLDLRTFQKQVIDTYSEYATLMFNDDLIEEFIAHSEDPDIHDIHLMHTEFTDANPGYDVKSIIPVDLKGAFVFIVTPQYQLAVM